MPLQNSMFSNYPLLDKLREGRQKQQVDHAEKEKLKLGNLRAGNSGILTVEGQFAGSCPMETHLRQLGISLEELADNKLIMFQLGILSEEAITSDLMPAIEPGQVLLREEQIPIEWTTSNGTRVTGRPDLVICNANLETGMNLPVLGIEAKSIASIWTTCDILFNAQPKLGHLIQSAHYAWKLGTPDQPLPYKLLYKQYANQVIPDWKLKQLPAVHESLRSALEWSGNRVKQIVPFEVVFDIRIDERGQVHFKLENVDTWTKSIVNVADIERYYEFVSRISETKDLGQKLTTIDVVGRPAAYSQCDKYCPAHMMFGKYQHDYSLWRDQVQLYLDNRSKQRERA
jgi:hypothetical protein